MLSAAGLVTFVRQSAARLHTRGLHGSCTMSQQFIEQLQRQNPHYSRYADRIRQLAREAPEQLDARVEAYKKNQLVATSDSQPRPFSSAQSSKYDTAATSDHQQTGGRGRLDDVMRVDLLKALTTVEVADLWMRHFSSRPGSLSAVLSAVQYTEMRALWSRHSSFLLPLPRDRGFEFFLLQFAGAEAHFTPLISYQAHGADAASCLQLFHYDELVASRNIVLLRAQFDSEQLTAVEARCLMDQLQLFYYQPSEERRQLLQQFSYSPDTFQYQQLVDALQHIQLPTQQ